MVDIDQATVERAKKGDHKAFRRLYDHYAPFVWRIVYRTAGGDKDTAAEIVQDTFINIHRSLKTFGFDASPGTWVYRIAFNAAKTFLLKRKRQRSGISEYDDDLHAGTFRTDEYDAAELVDKVLAALPIEDRFLLVAREVDGMSFDEIAAITGKSAEALRVRMFRMKQRIALNPEGRPIIEEVPV